MSKRNKNKTRPSKEGKTKEIKIGTTENRFWPIYQQTARNYGQITLNTKPYSDSLLTVLFVQYTINSLYTQYRTL